MQKVRGEGLKMLQAVSSIEECLGRYPVGGRDFISSRRGHNSRKQLRPLRRRRWPRCISDCKRGTRREQARVFSNLKAPRSGSRPPSSGENEYAGLRIALSGMLPIGARKIATKSPSLDRNWGVIWWEMLPPSLPSYGAPPHISGYRKVASVHSYGQEGGAAAHR